MLIEGHKVSMSNWILLLFLQLLEPLQDILCGSPLAGVQAARQSAVDPLQDFFGYLAHLELARVDQPEVQSVGEVGFVILDCDKSLVQAHSINSLIQTGLASNIGSFSVDTFHQGFVGLLVVPTDGAGEELLVLLGFHLVHVAILIRADDNIL